MKYAKLAKLLSGLAARSASAAREAAEGAELYPDDEIEMVAVLAITNTLRESILWIERSSAKIEEQST